MLSRNRSNICIPGIKVTLFPDPFPVCCDGIHFFTVVVWESDFTAHWQGAESGTVPREPCEKVFLFLVEGLQNGSAICIRYSEHNSCISWRAPLCRESPESTGTHEPQPEREPTNGEGPTNICNRWVR